MLSSRHLNKLQYLIYKTFGCSANPNIGQNDLNFSSFQLSELKLSILSHGFDFFTKWEEIYSVTEVFFTQLDRLQPESVNKFNDLKAT